ncbi:MAG: hypothetical protein PHY47_01710 [Lachnospiraceae bacterium]|nr:hypothetical protein [Lachnospiraceae bacterium]
MESAEKFLEMEIAENLNKQTYNGYAYWTYNRFSIFNIIDVQVNDRNEQTFTPTISKQDKMKRYYKVLFTKKYKIFENLMNGEILVFNHPRRVKKGDLYECVYTDDIVSKLKNVRVLESSYQSKHFEPTNTQNLIYLDQVEVLSELQYYYYRIFQKKNYDKDKENFYHIAKKLKNYIQEYFEVNINADVLTNCLFQGYCVYRFSYHAMEKIFQTMRPKIIIECASYCTPIVMIANEIAKLKNIPTIELQHGVMGKNHMGYNYAEKGIVQFPDIILTYSEYWNRVTRFPLDKENVIACGYPYFERNVQEYIKKGIMRKKQVLFISQTVIGMTLSKFAVELYDKVKDLCDYTFVYKLHPGECSDWKKRYPELADSDICVIDNNEKSIYELFAESSVQIGVFSTAVYEGLGFGLKTFLVKAYRSEDMEELCKEGYATMVESVEPITEYLLSQPEKMTFSYDKFWEKNATEKIITMINTCIDQ